MTHQELEEMRLKNIAKDREYMASDPQPWRAVLRAALKALEAD